MAHRLRPARGESLQARWPLRPLSRLAPARDFHHGPERERSLPRGRRYECSLSWLPHSVSATSSHGRADPNSHESRIADDREHPARAAQPSRQVPRAARCHEVALDRRRPPRGEADYPRGHQRSGTRLALHAHCTPVLTEEVRYADEIKQAGRGGIEVRGELGDVIAEALELDDRGRGG